MAANCLLIILIRQHIKAIKLFAANCGSTIKLWLCHSLVRSVLYAAYRLYSIIATVVLECTRVTEKDSAKTE
jgi:hypothetical protein